MNVVMIMCHKNAEQVVRFAARCVTGQTDVIIHCDSKMPDAQYARIVDFVNASRGVYLLEQRLCGRLFDRSLVDMEMLMVEYAGYLEKTEDKHYDYYLLCSGQDYLIKPFSWIESELKRHYPCPFMDCTPHDPSNWVGRSFEMNAPLKKYHNWVNAHFPKGSLKNFPKEFVRKGFRLVEIVCQKLLRLFRCTTFDKLQCHGIDAYGGSQWWILPDVIIREIHARYKQGGNVIETLLNGVISPDETFFQTMAMQTSMKHLVKLNPVDMITQDCKTWSYFRDEGKPFKGHPYHFTTHELEKLRNSSCWFARKFDMTEDAEIFDLVDRELLQIGCVHHVEI